MIGDAAVDLTFRVSTGPDEKASVDEAERGLGGTGANAAVAAARLGAQVRISCTVGDDPLGPWVLEALRSAGIGTELCVAGAGRTEVAVVLIEESGRRLFVDPGVGYRHELEQATELAGWADVLYLTHVEPELVQLVAESGGVTVVVGVEATDLATAPWREALERVDVVITNQAGAAAAGAALSGSSAALIVTAGADGAVLVRNGVEMVITAPSVVAVDATGAGDCLAGVLCQSLGLGRDLETATRRAVAAASLSTTRLGTQTAFPGADELSIQGAGT